MTMPNTTINLAGEWTLSKATGESCGSISLPGDIHSALLHGGQIPDPYYGFNEEAVQWVSETDWIVERTFEVEQNFLAADSIYLNLDVLDTVCEISLNDHEVGSTANRFRRFRFEAKPFLKSGENRLRMVFRSAPKEMKKRAEKLPYPIPYSTHGQKYANWNLLRKPMCHAGWDWGIAMGVAGAAGSLELRATNLARIDQVMTWTKIEGRKARVEVAVDIVAPAECSLTWTAQLDGKQQDLSAVVPGGASTLRTSFEIEDPKLWWPNDYGEQHLYALKVSVGNETVNKRLGLRTLEVKNDPAADGRPLTFCVNGIDIFAKGANWIPSDALPARQTPGRERKLLESARAAHMNMIRVWGGGQYESDEFYDLCDELGLLVWQDFMFSCALYPADAKFLGEVRREVDYQVRRLQSHPCMALWCGDNECLGALTWYPESQKNRDPYLIDWDRLNQVRSEAIRIADDSQLYWPSSPCAGPGDFSDTFHTDGSGDMHYWAVWHEGKSFDAYYQIKPRFCSEFGFQSFPSLPTIRTYCPEDEYNITSPTMEFHQRNNAGNRLINDMFSRYFRMPAGFAQTVYLSQVQQAVAIKTAVEFWRTLRPRCMGTLYWQLNDVWPVASWSSLEYSGRWKQLHHHARRFYAPTIVCFVPRGDQIELWIVNDRPTSGSGSIKVELWSFGGEILKAEDLAIEIAPSSAVMIKQWPKTEFCLRPIDASTRFLQAELTGTVGLNSIRQENTFWLSEYKKCRLERPKVEMEFSGDAVTLTTSAPAFFVQVDAEEGEFDDNSITLLPGRTRTLKSAGVKKPLTVTHLAESYL